MLKGTWNIESIHDYLKSKTVELNIPLTIHNIDVNQSQLVDTENGYEGWMGLYTNSFESSYIVYTAIVSFEKKVDAPLKSASVAMITLVLREAPASEDVTVVMLQDFHFKDGYLICDNSDITYGKMPIGGDLEPSMIYVGTVKMKKPK